jgi:hypothetical protein
MKAPRSAYQINAHLLHKFRSRCPYEESPIVLISIARAPDQLVLVAYEDHDALHAIDPDSRPLLNLLLHAPFGICSRVFPLQLGGQQRIRRGCGLRPAHGAVRCEVVAWVVIRIEVCELHIKARGLDFVRGGCVGPLCHAGCAQQVVALRPYGCEEEELADLGAISDMRMWLSFLCRLTGQRSSCAISSDGADGGAAISAMSMWSG